MAVVMGGDIAAVVAIITAGAVAAATTMAGGIIATGGDIVSGHFAEAASCVDGSRLARVFSRDEQMVACSHVSGLSVRSDLTAGLDGFR